MQARFQNRYHMLRDFVGITDRCVALGAIQVIKENDGIGVTWMVVRPSDYISDKSYIGVQHPLQIHS